VLPSIIEYNKRKGKLPQNLIFSFAALIRFYKGEWKGETLPVNDSPEVLGFFNEVWKCDDSNHVAYKVLSNTPYWGEDLTKIEGMAESVKRALDEMKAL
jgi:tagaturonate reductase